MIGLSNSSCIYSRSVFQLRNHPGAAIFKHVDFFCFSSITRVFNLKHRLIKHVLFVYDLKLISRV